MTAARPTCAGTDCAAMLGRTNKSGLCRSCLMKRTNADPAAQARRIAGIRKALQRPEVRANRLAALAAYNLDPAIREKRSEAGKRTYRQTLWSEKCKAATVSPETIAKRTQSRMERLYAWCPEEYRDEYRTLNQRKGIPAAEAKAIILARIETDKRRQDAAEAALSPFDRQMRALRKGAELVDKVKLTTRYGFSIAGGSL